METTLTFSVVSTADRKSCRNRRSPVLKRAIRLAGNKTSISLEDQFWDGLREIARNENIRLYALIERIDTNRTRRKPDRRGLLAKFARLRNVRWWAKADICSAPVHVRFGPKRTLDLSPTPPVGPPSVEFP